MTRTKKPIVYFGVYDTGKPRHRLMIQAVRAAGYDVIEVHSDIWKGVEDKSRTHVIHRLWLLVRWLAAYPILVVRYLRAPRHEVVMVGYPGVLDVIVLWPFARLRGARIALDVFISIYDTLVDDRRLMKPRGLAARATFHAERLACQAADLVILDTESHASYFQNQFGLRPDRTGVVPVGFEAAHFRAQPLVARSSGEPLRVLFYGQFIPLHGVATILEAAHLAESRSHNVIWSLIGTGQEVSTARRFLDRNPLKSLTWTPWVPYDQLKDEIAQADVGLGIFGTSGKAGRVIPNKVYQMLGAGRPVVTRDSPAIRELVQDGDAGIRLVPPGDPEALLAAVLELGESGEAPQPETVARFTQDRQSAKIAELIAALEA